jgi:hypothetical protein
MAALRRLWQGTLTKQQRFTLDQRMEVVLLYHRSERI